MKISIKRENELNLQLPVASGLVLNRLTAGYIQEGLKKSGINVTREQTIVFIKALKAYRRQHPEWVLLEIHSSGGYDVEIRL